MEILIDNIKNIKKNLNSQNFEKYSKIINKVSAQTGGCKTLKQACEKANIKYDDYYNARKFFIKNKKYEKNNDSKNSEESNIFNKKNQSETLQKGGYQSFTDALINKREIKQSKPKIINKKSESKSETSLNMQILQSDKKKKTQDISMLGFDDLLKENDEELKKGHNAIKEKYGN